MRHRPASSEWIIFIVICTGWYCSLHCFCNLSEPFLSVPWSFCGRNFCCCIRTCTWSRQLSVLMKPGALMQVRCVTLWLSEEGSCLWGSLSFCRCPFRLCPSAWLSCLHRVLGWICCPLLWWTGSWWSPVRPYVWIYLHSWHRNW